jgi:hypothetical protein
MQITLRKAIQIEHRMKALMIMNITLRPAMTFAVRLRALGFTQKWF